MAARSTGKIKAVIQAGAGFIILLLMIPYTMGCISYEILRGTSIVVVSLAAIYALYSGVEYIWANRGYVLRLLTDKGD